MAAPLVAILFTRGRLTDALAEAEGAARFLEKRSRHGVVSNPWRVVAPIKVKRGKSMRTERADGPSPIIRSRARSSIAG